MLTKLCIVYEITWIYYKTLCNRLKINKIALLLSNTSIRMWTLNDKNFLFQLLHKYPISWFFTSVFAQKLWNSCTSKALWNYFVCPVWNREYCKIWEMYFVCPVSDIFRNWLGIYRKYRHVLGHFSEIFLAFGLRPRARKISEIRPRTRGISY